MSLHSDFPPSLCAVLVPEQQWFPAAEELRRYYDKLFPQLVARVHEEVRVWRDSGYVDASETSRALPAW